MHLNKITLIVALIISVSFVACGGGSDSSDSTNNDDSQSMYQQEDRVDPMKEKGVGPITSVELGPIDEAMAAEGEAIYNSKCTSCHKPNEKYVGPAHKGITKRRTPEWIMNMILNPENMLANDPIAKQLQGDYLSPMANQNLTEDEARKVLEYLRTL